MDACARACVCVWEGWGVGGGMCLCVWYRLCVWIGDYEVVVRVLFNYAKPYTQRIKLTCLYLRKKQNKNKQKTNDIFQKIVRWRAFYGFHFKHSPKLNKAPRITRDSARPNLDICHAKWWREERMRWNTRRQRQADRAGGFLSWAHRGICLNAPTLSARTKAKHSIEKMKITANNQPERTLTVPVPAQAMCDERGLRS